MTKITKEAKQIIITKYLDSRTLDKITEETGFSKGSIFNTIKAWKKEVGEDKVDEVRRFKMHLNQSNISINDCLIGFRIANMLKKFDINDEFESDYFDEYEDNQLLSNPPYDNENSSDLTEKVEATNLPVQKINNNHNNNEIYDFISKIYHGCKNYGISPDDLVNWAKNLIEFAPHLDDKQDWANKVNTDSNESQIPYIKSYTIPKVSELSTYIEREKRRHVIIKRQIKALNDYKLVLKSLINKKVKQLNDLRKNENFTLQYLRWYSNLHEVLINNYNIDIKQVYGRFAKAMDDFKKYDFDAVKIINIYESIESLKEEFDSFKKNIDIQLGMRNDLYQQTISLQAQVYRFDKKIKRVEELEDLGFGPKELEQLSNVVAHIASDNNIDKNEAIQKFLKDVSNQYDSKLGFESTINGLNKEKSKIEDEIPAYRTFINTKVVAVQSMEYLQNNGVTVFDIIGIALLMKAFLSGHFAFHSDKSIMNSYTHGNKVETSRNSIHSWQLFIDNLKHLKNLSVEVTAKTSELDGIKTQINKKIIKKENIDNQLAQANSDVYSLTIQGIYFMETLNQFSTKIYNSILST